MTCNETPNELRSVAIRAFSSGHLSSMDYGILLKAAETIEELLVALDAANGMLAERDRDRKRVELRSCV